MSGTPVGGNLEVQELLQEFRSQAEKVEEDLDKILFRLGRFRNIY